MFTPEKLEECLAEIRKLNGNLEKGQEVKQSLDRLTGELKTFNGNMKTIHGLAKQLAILNQILLKVGRTAGGIGVVKSLVSSFVHMAERAR